MAYLKKRNARGRRRMFGDDDDSIEVGTVTDPGAGTVATSSSSPSGAAWGTLAPTSVTGGSLTNAPVTQVTSPGGSSSSSSGSSPSGGNSIINGITSFFGGAAASSQTQPGLPYLPAGMDTTTLLLLAAVGIGGLYFIMKKD